MSETSHQVTPDYDTEMQAGREALAVRDFRSTYRHFGSAHNIGHGVLAKHLAAHRGLLATAWRQRRLDRVGTQTFLIAAAFLFDRKPRPRSADTRAEG